MATIKEVAAEAGVSVGTVSRVLNNSGYVGEESRKKVENAIKKLSYTPNRIAQALNYKKTRMIALMVPDIKNPFFPEMTRAIEDVALSQGYTVMLCNSDQDPVKEAEYLNAFQLNYVDGIILATHTLDIHKWMETTIPIVSLDRVSEQLLPSITSHNYDGAKKAVQLLVEKGAKNIAHIKGPEHVNPVIERHNGFVDQANDLQLPYVIGHSDFELESAEEVAFAFYENNPNVDGIFCSNDTIAIGFLKTALKLGKKVPEDLQIIGFDGITFGKMIYPEISTIAQPIYEMGKTAAELLIKLINNENVEQTYFKLPIEVLERGTTRK
ncbi:LacI family DNA-binding transcriptional regulator [Sutcliffiella sp. NC1]|uniref:LacI family DNA-binding transcriptional regulator n=1 Tax=Sutcliffiella sp. NC1 TaxID=3004096 RepID=UPI0022DE0D50|nr:LacI family DNA-binding transcriptional regulator [Sutcliffiella sp. NC1]WBL14643.1 LacI family DNA-binding transcriptional regulator [Sutcliffiella sp. NC1]